MNTSEFKAFAKHCKDVFGDTFRNGCRVECFPHDVYSWKEVAIDSEGNVMLYHGDHCNRNPESVWGVHTDGKVYCTSHTNGAYQGAVRTISIRDTWATVWHVAHDRHEVTEVPITQAVAEMAFDLLREQAKYTRKQNEAKDVAIVELKGKCSEIFGLPRWKKYVQSMHESWFKWARNIYKETEKTIFCSKAEYNVYGWHQNTSMCSILGQPWKMQCTCKVPGGLKVSEKEFYKRYFNALERIAKTLLTPEKIVISNYDQYLNFLKCSAYGFYLVYDKKTNTNTYYIEGVNNFSNAPEDYAFSGATWRDGLTKATEEQEKAVKKWELVVGTNELDVAMVNWAKRLWRDPTEEEINALA